MPIPTFYCPACKQTSVADRDESGDVICPRCDPEHAQTIGSDLYSPTVKRIMRDWWSGKFEPR